MIEACNSDRGRSSERAALFYLTSGFLSSAEPGRRVWSTAIVDPLRNPDRLHGGR